MHYYKRNIGDYAKKAGRLSMLQHGSYTLLIDACYDREQFPTKAEAIDWTWASSAAEVEAVEFVLAKFFTLEGDVYVQSRIREELEDYHAKAATNKRIATERETKRKEVGTKRSRAVDASSPNQEPITNNQEPLNTEAKASMSPGKPDDAQGAEQPVDKETLPACPHTALIDLFAEQLPTMPRPKPELWAGARAAALKSRWRWVLTAKKRDGTRYATSRAEALGWFKRFFAFVAESDFLTGRDGKWTACDLGWLCNETNFAKVVQGNYTNKEAA